MSFRKERTESLLTKLVGEFLAHEAGPASLITVTHIAFNEKAKRATIFLTVLPESKEKAALEFTHRRSSDLREYVRAHARLGILPVFDFVIDAGEKNRQFVDGVAQEDQKKAEKSETGGLK